MTVDEAVNYFGGTAKLCEALKIKDQNIYYWRRVGHISHLQQYIIRDLSNGRLALDDDLRVEAWK